MLHDECPKNNYFLEIPHNMYVSCHLHCSDTRIHACKFCIFDLTYMDFLFAAPEQRDRGECKTVLSLNHDHNSCRTRDELSYDQTDDKPKCTRPSVQGYLISNYNEEIKMSIKHIRIVMRIDGLTVTLFLCSYRNCASSATHSLRNKKYCIA